MKKITRLVLAGTLVFSLLLTGCSSKKSNPQMDALQGQISQLQKENEKLLTQVQDLQKQIEVLKEKEEEHLQEPETEESKITYPVYGADLDTLEKEEIGMTESEEGEDILTTLKHLAATLSESNFEGLPILVTDIKEIEGKKIAIIDLKEDPAKEASWMTGFFQGSTGGLMTTNSITETFLQRDLDKSIPWIDGIQVLYEGQVTETDHMPDLGKIIYR